MIHNEHHFLHDMLHNNMSKIYILQSTLMFVKSLIGIFIPVYLFSLGFSMVIIAQYMITLSIFSLLLFPLATRIISKVGFKYTLLLSLPFYVLHISSLTFIAQGGSIIYLAAALFGIHISLFWPAYHLEVSQQGSNKNRAKEIGTLQILVTLVSSISPLIGGLFLDYLSYLQLLTFALSILFIGFLPFVFSEDIKIKKKVLKFRDYKILLKKARKQERISFIASGAEFSLAILFWPIILFILLDNSFSKLGTLMTGVGFLSVLLIGYLKERLDKQSKTKTLKLATKGMSTTWFLRCLMLFFLAPILYLIEAINRLVLSVYQLSFNSLFYNNAKNFSDHFEYVMTHELYVHISRIIIGLVAMILALLLGSSIYFFIVIAIIGIFVPFGLAKYSEN